jgi:hypothetical protein
VNTSEARAQTADNFQRNSFTCGNRNLLAPYSWLFQQCLIAPYRLANPADAWLVWQASAGWLCSGNLVYPTSAQCIWWEGCSIYYYNHNAKIRATIDSLKSYWAKILPAGEIPTVQFKHKQQSTITNSWTCGNTFEYLTINCSKKCCCSCVMSVGIQHKCCVMQSSYSLQCKSRNIYPHCNPSHYIFVALVIYLIVASSVKH